MFCVTLFGFYGGGMESYYRMIGDNYLINPKLCMKFKVTQPAVSYDIYMF